MEYVNCIHKIDYRPFPASTAGLQAPNAFQWQLFRVFHVARGQDKRDGSDETPRHRRHNFQELHDRTHSKSRFQSKWK